MSKTMDALRAGDARRREAVRGACPACGGLSGWHGLVSAGELVEDDGTRLRARKLCPLSPLGRIEDSAATGALAKRYEEWLSGR